jgi:CubicO group peptidase (beta-lactamase class C family)
MKYLFLLFLTLCLETSARAQTLRAIPQLSGPAVPADSVTQAVQRLVRSARITGLQVVILRRRQIVYQHSFGVRDTQTGQPLNDSTAMYAASLTKPVCAYLFLRLVAKGLFDLDRPVHYYLNKPIGAYDKWKDLATDTASFNRITARMLLSHSAGLPILRALYHNSVQLIARPGDKFYYSNEGMNLLGFIIEEHTGQHLEELAQAEVFTPLRMPHTSLVWKPAYAQNYAVAYYKDGTRYGIEKRESARAAGSMTTTGPDYARFVRELLHPEHLPAALARQLLQPQVRITSRRGFGPQRDSLAQARDLQQLAWGLGLGLFHSKYGPAFFHTGHGEANQNYFVAYPRQGIAVVLLSSSENFERAARSLLAACIRDVDSPLLWLGYLE